MRILKTGGNINSCEKFPERSYLFMLFRTPAEIFINYKKIIVERDSVFICKSSVVRKVTYSADEKIRNEWICFDMNNSDIEYIKGLNISLESSVKINNDVGIYGMVQVLNYEYINNSGLTDDFFSHAMNSLFTLINKNIVNSIDSKENYFPYHKKLLKIRKCIYEQPYYKWNIDEICSKMQISRTYFHRIYFSAFGVTCMHDVIQSRIEFAKDLLTNTDFPINIVAEKCGYESDSYFMRQFKRCVGITPTNYRRNFNGNCKHN